MACTDISTNTGLKVYIGAQAALPTDMAQTNWEAIVATSWTEISEIGSLGERGPQDAPIEYKTLAGTVCKQKGSTNYGNCTIQVADITEDAGQLAVVAARATKLSYPFKVVHDDDLGGTNTPSIEYFPAKIGSGMRDAVSDADSIRTRSWTLMLDNYLEVKRSST